MQLSSLTSFSEILHCAIKNTLDDGCKWQRTVPSEDKVVCFSQICCHDTVPCSICVVQQRPPLQRFVLYPLLKCFNRPPKPSPSSRRVKSGQVAKTDGLFLLGSCSCS